MPLFIDTFNVLHTVGVLPPDLAGIDVPGLIELLAASRYRDEQITLVCDGAPPAPPPPLAKAATPANVAIKYSGVGKPADDLIGQMIRASSAPKRVTVVSTDHVVQRSARKRRCKVLTSQDFLQHLADDAALPAARPRAGQPAAPSAMSEEQVSRWVDLFKIDESTLAIPSKAKPSPQASPVPPQDEADDREPLSGPPSAPPHDPVHLEPGQALPEDVIEQAERLLARFEQSADVADVSHKKKEK